MSSAIDDDDLAVHISTPQARRSSKDGSEANGSVSAGTGSATASMRTMAPPRVRNKGAQERMGAYNIVKTLGEGSFGKVKLAVHQSTNQKVALKIISRRKLVTRDMAGRIEREIQYLQLLRHPHIIKLYTVITMPGEIVMVLEYAGGELFDYIVKNGKMAEDKARKFFQQIVCAVEYCHRHKIVHRDLKPENLLLDEQLNVKIADFGLSNIMTDGNFLKTSCGSPNYAAPEVISGKLYAGPEVDVWSCGVILYVLLCGRLPFDDEYIPNLFKKISQGNFNVPSYLSPGAVRLIKKMLQTNPMNRATIYDIRQDPWFVKDLPEYLQPSVEDFLDTGVDPNKAIDVHTLAKGKPVAVQEKIHQNVVGKLGKTMGYGPDDVHEALAKDEPSAIKDAYLIVRENQMMKNNPSLAQDMPATFMAQSPPTFHPSDSALPRSPMGRPGPSPLAGSLDHPRHGSTSSSITGSLAPASTIAVLPSSLPDYHTAYMKGQMNKATSPTQPDDGPDGRLRTKEEQEATSRRLKPHSRSAANLQRHAEKPGPMTAITDKGAERAKKPKAQKWQFGIRSRNTPCEAMLALYKALNRMGAQWEVPRSRDPGAGSGEGSPERQREGSQSPEYSDSDPEPGTDPEYATHSDQERRRSRRAANDSSGMRRGRDRHGRWNDYGYTLPEDPWVICARFKKDNMYPPGVNPPSSTHSSRVDLHDRRTSTMSSPATSQLPSATGSMENIAAVGPGIVSAATSLHGSDRFSRANESAWVYVTIQLYSIEKDFYLVDFKCAGYERLVRRFAQEVGGSGEIDVVRKDLAPEGYRAEDGTENEWGEELIGAGRSGEEKDVSSPFPFLDVASRLITALAEAQE